MEAQGQDGLFQPADTTPLVPLESCCLAQGAQSVPVLLSLVTL